MKYTPPLGSLEDDAPYVDGNPSAGIRGSVVPAAPFNQVQRELVHVISSAGIEPSNSDMTQVWQALQKLLSISDAEKWRKSMIGALFSFGRATLPEGFVQANGDLVLFEDWPELEEAYEDGAFEGMLLAYNASSEDISAWRGKFRPNAANPTGLYVPDLQGLFLRNAGTAGRSESSGLPSLNGRVSFLYREDSSTEGVFSLVDGKGSVGNLVTPGSGSINIFWADLALNASSLNSIFGASSEVQPPNVNLVAGIYLGITS